MEAVKRRVSFADLQRMPDDGNRYELYGGELRVVPSPLPRHQIVSVRLLETLIEYRREAGGLVFHPPFDIVLSDYDVLQPDLLYFGPRTAGRVTPDEYVRFPPDLAIEVVSPSTASRDRGRKRELFAKHGLREYWVVDPARRCVEISVLTGNSYQSPMVVDRGTVGSPGITGLTIDLARLFDGL